MNKFQIHPLFHLEFLYTYYQVIQLHPQLKEHHTSYKQPLIHPFLHSDHINEQQSLLSVIYYLIQHQLMLVQVLLVTCSTLQADRKSTRLNSSHVSISYAVFCLKKKKTFAAVTLSVEQTE